MIILHFPESSNFVYLGISTPKPWHNPTFIACRPFSILTFIMFIIVLKQEINKSTILFNYFLLGFFALLSMWFKSSFMLSFLQTVALFLTYFWITKKIEFIRILKIGLTFFPTIIIIIILYKYVYANNSDNAIGFGFGDFWHHYSKNILISIILGILFPLYVIIIGAKKLTFDMKIA